MANQQTAADQQWVSVKVAEVAESRGVLLTVGDKKIALFRVADQFYAVDDTCSHEEASLSEGTLWTDDDELTVECPKHGAMFDLRSGQVLSLPAVRSVNSYETRVEGDEVLVSTEPRS